MFFQHLSKYKIEHRLYDIPTDRMLKRLLIFGLGTSLIQVFLFYFFIFIVYIFAELLTYSPSNDTNGDYEVWMLAVVFPFLILTQNLIAATINNLKVTYGLIAFATAVYLFLLIDVITSISFKSVICLVFGLVVISIKTKIDDRLQ